MITPETIEEVKNRLVRVYDPLQIYLFGSYAWGTPNDDSDLDLLVVVESSEEKRHKRSKIGFAALWGLGISKDLVVYTRAELAAYATDPNTLVAKVLKDGRELYARS